MSIIKRLPRLLTGAFFGLAFAVLAWLVVTDVWFGFHPSLRHERFGALALIFVGSAFICLQFHQSVHWKEMLKGLLLGLAFVLWGGEQFLPSGSTVTAVDSAVIAIFVVDLGLAIAGRLESPAKVANGRSQGMTKAGLQ
jgi:hypothetical protein